ncbi:MAG: glycosyltransferase family 4 protein [Burkholderiaceae bacterium]
MRILVNCDRFPWPLDNGQNLRIWHYVRALRDRHEFDLVCWGDEPAPAELSDLFGSVLTFPRPWFAADAGWWTRWRERVDYRCIIPASSATRDAIAQATAAGRYDLVWMSGWDTVTSVPRPLECAWLADIVDDGLIDLERELAHETSLTRKLRLAKRWAQIFQVERHYFGAADACAVVSNVDAASLARACRHTPIAVLPNGVDAEFFRPSGEPEAPDTLVFEGRMDFAPNVDAVIWFVTEVLPRVRQVRPSVRFLAVGNKPAPSVRALAGPGVEVTGWVDDVRPYLARAALFVAPLRMGAGIKNKILQAWAMGKCVLTTPEAIGGLLAEPGRNLELADGAPAMAARILELLADPQRRAAVGAAGRATIEAHYTWARRAEALEAVMQQAVQTYRGKHHA